MELRMFYFGLMLLAARVSLAFDDPPADALQPANRSEVALLMQRIASLEQQTMEQESRQQKKITELEDRLRTVEYAQPMQQRKFVPSPLMRKGRQSWYFLWFETAGSNSTNGDITWNTTDPLSDFEPEPYEMRGRLVWGPWGEHPAQYVIDSRGDEVEHFWIAPSPAAWAWSRPLERGFLLGVELKSKPDHEPSFLKKLNESLRIEEYRGGAGLRAY